MSDGAVVHHSLGQLWCVFADVAERGGGDAFEGHLGLPEAQQQQRDGAGVHHRLRQRCVGTDKWKNVSGRWRRSTSSLVGALTFVVTCNAAQRPGGGFLHRRVKLLQAEHQGADPPATNHSLRQFEGVFGHRTHYECSCLFVEPLQMHTRTHTHN